MTVTELKKKCEGMIADGYGDSEIFLHMEMQVLDDVFFPLEAGFSSVVYNEGAREGIIDYLIDEDDQYEIGNEELEKRIDELGVDTGNYVILG